jgi:effector-binding domain-containing protein
MALPAGRALTTLHHGSPDTVADAYQALFAQVSEPVGPVVEEYLRDREVRVTVRSA